MPQSIEVEYEGMTFVALGVEYEAGRPATLISPPEQDKAEWDVLYLKGDPGLNNLTDLLRHTVCDDIEELICERCRG